MTPRGEHSRSSRANRVKRFVNAPTGLIYPGDPGAPTGVNFPDRDNWAPRFGFAWDVFGNAKTAIRGASGLLRHPKGRRQSSVQRSHPVLLRGQRLLQSPKRVGDWTHRVSFAIRSAPTTRAPRTDSLGAPQFHSEFCCLRADRSSSVSYLVDPHLRTPYVYQYNRNIQQQLPGAWFSRLVMLAMTHIS